MKLKYPVMLTLFGALSANASDIVISGVIDGPLTGGTPKSCRTLCGQRY